MAFTEYELTNKSRPYELLDRLVRLANDEHKELEKEIETVLDLFFGQAPKGLIGQNQNIVDLQKEWLLLHVNHNWVCVEGEIYEIPSSVGLKSKNITFKNITTNETHIWTNFLFQYEQTRILTHRLTSLENWIKKLTNNIANSESFNRYLLSDSLEFNEALLLLLGFNPVDQLTLLLNRHNYDSMDFLFTGFIFNNDIEEYRLLNKGWENLKNGNHKFIEWATIEKGFFVKVRSIIKPKVLKELHKLLVDNFLIENCNFVLWKKWQWIKSDALLRYLMSEIYYQNESNNYIIYPRNENIFKILLEYINQKGRADLKRKGVFTKYEEEPKGYEIVDTLINKLIESIN